MLRSDVYCSVQTGVGLAMSAEHTVCQYDTVLPPRVFAQHITQRMAPCETSKLALIEYQVEVAKVRACVLQDVANIVRNQSRVLAGPRNPM